MDVGKKKKKYNGTLDCLVKVTKNEGVTGLWKGALSNVFRGMGATLVLVIYDDAKAWAEKKILGH
jgi:solute carrier family 25 (adenine nucleotide translocator) protein 4/5/6/31